MLRDEFERRILTFAVFFALAGLAIVHIYQNTQNRELEILAKSFIWAASLKTYAFLIEYFGQLTVWRTRRNR